MIVTKRRIARDELEPATGWSLQPEGLCRGDVCVPYAVPDGDTLDLGDVSAALQRPFVGDGPFAMGPPSGRVLESAVAPELELPDRNGEPFALSSLRGRKVLLLAWASW